MRAERRVNLNNFFKHSDQLSLAYCSGNLVNDLTPLEQYEGRYGPDTIFPGSCRVVIYVHLCDLHFIRVVPGKLFNDWSIGFTGASPGRPEVNEAWQIGFQDILFEFCIG